VLRTASVSALDPDKDTLSLTREKCCRIFPLFFLGKAEFGEYVVLSGRGADFV